MVYMRLFAWQKPLALASVGLLLLAPGAGGWEQALEKGRAAAVGYRLEEAETELRLALAHAKKEEKRPWAAPLVLYWIGDFYVRVPFAPGADQAEPILRESAAGFDQVFGADSLALVPVFMRLAQHQLEHGNEPGARASATRAQQITEGLRTEGIIAGAEIADPNKFFNAAVRSYYAKQRRANQPASAAPAD